MTKQIVDLEEYIRIGEPSQRERAEAWQLAIGLQAVDQLHVSSYLLQTASDPHLKQQQMTELIHKSIATVKRITIGLQERGILRRDNGKRDGFWTIIYDEKLLEGLTTLSNVKPSASDGTRR